MADRSAIEWTDATWNPTTGCTKISPGCAHCYIERTPAFRIAGRKFVNGHIPLQFHTGRIGQPLHWRKPRRVFVNSLSDLFHEDVPDVIIDQVFAVMALAPQHTFQLLTKRPARMRDYFRLLEDSNGLTREERIDRAAEEFGACHANIDTAGRWPLPNVWLGVSVENQHFADERVDQLRRTPAAVHFISAEPLLERVDLRFTPERLVDWVIVGGESGPKARGFSIEWARSIVAQCRAAAVPCFVKQLGASAYETCPVCHGHGTDDQGDAYCGRCLGCHRQTVFYRDKKGGDPSEWPEDLRVREFPAVRPS